MTPRLVVFDSVSALVTDVAGWLAARLLAAPNEVSLALSGGSTPKGLYEQLAHPPWQGLVPWHRLQVFWGDERCVPSDHPESNQGMARKALLAHVPIPSANCHPIPVDGTPEDAAISYEKTLRSFAEHRSARTLFDVLLLGLGEDGHTASLFPSSEVLTERHAWVAAVTGMQSEARITLTYSALNRSEDAAFLVVGEKKRAILRRFLCGDPALPSVRVQPRGSVTVFADRAAAGE